MSVRDELTRFDALINKYQIGHLVRFADGAPFQLDEALQGIEACPVCGKEFFKRAPIRACSPVCERKLPSNLRRLQREALEREREDNILAMAQEILAKRQRT